MTPTFNTIDKKITSVLRKIGFPTLRYSIAVIFIWFGLLKILHYSPAQELVTKTIYWFSPTWFVPFLGWWEVLIGLCFLFKPLIRVGIPLLLAQMAGTFLPLLLLPEVVYGPIPILTLTLEGQYIIKNLIIIAAALVMGSTVREKRK